MLRLKCFFYRLVFKILVVFKLITLVLCLCYINCDLLFMCNDKNILICHKTRYNVPVFPVDKNMNYTNKNSSIILHSMAK